jgi:hypothetical protein
MTENPRVGGSIPPPRPPLNHFRVRLGGFLGRHNQNATIFSIDQRFHAIVEIGISTDSVIVMLDYNYINR